MMRIAASVHDGSNAALEVMQIITAMRPLSGEESEAIISIAETIESDSERDLLLADIRSCTVTSTVADGSMLMVNLEGYVRPEKWRQQQYKSRDGFRAEGVVKDKDGGDMYAATDISPNSSSPPSMPP